VSGTASRPEPLPLLYRDTHVVAVNKPSGLAVHRSKDTGRAPVLLQQLRDQLQQWVYPVHRLDRPTSGVIVFGLSPAAARQLSMQFRLHEVEKTYIAVVRGYTETEGTIDHSITDKEKHTARASVTDYRRLSTFEVPVAVGRYQTARYSLVEVRPRTGRRHQIRRHFCHISHPVIGDTMYGDGRHNRMFRHRLHARRLMLMAVRLTVRHPETGDRLALHAPPDADFQAVFRHFGWQYGD